MLESLDAIIATIAVVLVLSLIVQAIQQIVKQILNLKSKYMERELLMLFLSEDESKEIFEGWKKLQKRILPQSLLIKDVKGIGRNIVEELKRKLQSVGYKDLEILETFDSQKFKEIIGTLPIFLKAEARDILANVMSEIDLWFEYTKRAFQEHYERRMKVWAFGISFIVVIVMNADIRAVYKDFSSNKARKDIMVSSIPQLFALAERENVNRLDSVIAVTTIKNQVRLIDSLVNDKSLDLIRWNSSAGDPLWTRSSLFNNISELSNVAAKNIIGWLIMALLVSLGAPFWYDFLKMIMGVKNVIAGKKNQTEEKPAITKEIKSDNGNGNDDILPVG